MSTGFVPALDAEIAAIEADIKAKPDPRVIKLAELRRVRSNFYSDKAATFDFAAAVMGPTGPSESRVDAIRGPNGPTRPSASPVTGIVVMGPERSPGRKRSPEVERILKASAEFLRKQSGMHPVKTAVIYEALLADGIEVSGEDPKSNLSAMLSNAPQFRSHGRIGWTLE